MDKPATQQTISEIRQPRHTSSQQPGAETPEPETPAKPVLPQAEIEKLISDNMKLAYWFANQWQNIPGSSKEDIEAQAIHGLVKAANTYDPAKGSFAGYASQIIRNYLGHMHFHQGEKTSNEKASLDAPLGSEEGDEDSSMHDKYGDPDAEGQEMGASRSEAAQIIADEIEQIPEPDKSMVKRWMNGESYRDMQADFGISFMQIRNRVTAAMGNIRTRLAARGILGIEDIWPESLDDDKDGKVIYECLLAQVEISIATNALQEQKVIDEVRRFSTPAQDLNFLARASAGATKNWQVGDLCKDYSGRGTARVKEIKGDIVYLDNGDSMHKSKMRLPD